MAVSHSSTMSPLAHVTSSANVTTCASTVYPPPPAGMLSISAANASRFEDADGKIGEDQIASYVAKYATKGTGKSEAADRPIRSRTHIDRLDATDHHKQIMRTAWDLGGPVVCPDCHADGAHTADGCACRRTDFRAEERADRSENRTAYRTDTGNDRAADSGTGGAAHSRTGCAVGHASCKFIHTACLPSFGFSERVSSCRSCR